MTNGLTPTFNQIKAQVAAIRKKDPDARFIGIHARGRWEGNEFYQDNDATYRIVQCYAPLQLRMVLQKPSEDVTATVVITPLADNQLCNDTRVRLAMRRLHPMDRWQIIKLIFSARYIDPRIIEHVFMADLLMDLCPTEGYPPVPSGTLDAETAWEILFIRYLKMSTGTPDLIALLKWSCLPDAIALWQSADDPFRNAASAWIHQTAGGASKAILNCVSKHRQPMALPVGLALGVLYEKSLKGKLDKAVGRIEQLTGNTEIEPNIAKRWYAAAVDVVRHGFTESKERNNWLEQSDAILQSVGAEAFAHISDVSPLGFEQRLAQFGKALNSAISQQTISLTGDVLKSQERVFSHDLAQRRASRRIERATMAVRLLRWLEKASQERIADYGSFSEAAKAYDSDGGFVDWARQVIRGGESVKVLSQAYKKLFTTTTHIREKQNKAFAELLVNWTQVGSTGTPVRCVENVIEEVIAPLADQLPILMLLIDGMSCAVFRELLEDITAQGWAELCPADGSPLPAVIATIPSWTKLSRTSLFCGMLQEGDSRDELKGFASHAALRNFQGSKTAPLLFHKIDVTDAADDSLAEGLREKVASKSHRVVAVVNNAVDDHLLKGDQTDPKWTTDYIRALPALLQEAKSAGRIVVMLSDHGHMLESGTTLNKSGEGERWRLESETLSEGEIWISGDRVLAGGSKEVIAPWSEKIRYGAKKNGYHGGLTPQEMIVPMAVLTASDIKPDGWLERASYVPSWWERPIAELKVQVENEPVPIVKADSSSAKGQLPLFERRDNLSGKSDGLQIEQATGLKWIERFISSDNYNAQKNLAGQGLPNDETMHHFVSTLVKYGGKMTCTVLSRELNIPEIRLSGLIASVQRVLNVEGYAILSRDDPSQTVVLNVDLLKRQFELPD